MEDHILKYADRASKTQPIQSLDQKHTAGDPLEPPRLCSFDIRLAPRSEWYDR